MKHTRILVAAAAGAAALLAVAAVGADTASVDFESPTYTAGTIHN